MNTVTTVAVISFSAVFAYLLAFFRFAAALKNQFPADWQRLGHPEMLGVLGQLKYLGVVLGLIPISEPAARTFRSQIIRIRILAVVVTIGMAVLLALTA
jgi:hypothetical protein